MGIIGGLLGSGTAPNQSASPLLMNVLTAILSNPSGQTPGQNGESNLVSGIATLVNMFEHSGLSSQAQSWVALGANHPIEASDIMKVFGNSKVAEIAQQLGVDPELASTQIAQHLPSLIDFLTPNGELPQNVDQVSALASQLLGTFKKA